MTTSTLEQRLFDLNDLLVALLSSPVPSDQFQYLADNAQKVVPCDYLAICLLDPDVEEEALAYRVHSLLGFAAGAIPQRRFGNNEGVAAEVIRTMLPYTSQNLAEDACGCSDIEGILGKLGINVGLVVPLHQDERPLGALYFAARPETEYDEDDIAVACKLADGLSGALENSRIYQLLADDRSTLEAVLRSTQDAVMLVNSQGRVLMSNPAVREMFDISETEIIGRTLQETVDNRELIRLFASGEPGNVEVSLADGRTTQANLVRVGTSYGEQIGWAAVFRDISVLKQLEQMKNEFVNTVSHDLKNPISSILLAAGLLKRLGPLGEEQEQMQERIIGTANYMNELVSDLLDLGRITTGLDMDVEEVDMRLLVEEVIEALAAQIEEKQQNLQLNLPDSVVVHGNFARLKQVLLNLVGNASKYTPEKGRITVSITTAESHILAEQNQPDVDQSLLLVKVQDTGLGIPVADLPRFLTGFTGCGMRRRRILAVQGWVWRLLRVLLRRMTAEFGLKAKRARAVLLPSISPMRFY